MTRSIAAGLALLALVACGKGAGDKTAAADSLNRDLQLAPAESTMARSDTAMGNAPQPAPAPTTPAPAPAKPKPKPAAPAAPVITSFRPDKLRRIRRCSLRVSGIAAGCGSRQEPQ